MRLFVYGSLMMGQPYHHLLATAERLGEARTLPQYTLLDFGPYPGLVSGSTSVFGEVYEVPQRLIAQLDEYEDHPELYRRTEIELLGGEAAVVYLYVGPPVKRARPIGSGDWRQR